MTEVDYQMALLLQYKFEQDQKNKQNTDSDRLLALELQQQFQTEVEVERPSNNLVYKAPTNPSNSKSLVDPSWEVIDPTPDIHVLFMAFNQRFFWNALGSVTVSWSKRMTTCAGICSYQGRGGMCSITLSEPLLKLRPRKDLVETLLHEMIHAYLFVTNNNRDRDGHGPEFHKHMYRINAEAGTNITVYHDFHDEVRLYQQHWWRCDGPCQTRKPYFGMVRRATNRVPGPNDRWWEDHMRNCGGTFVKVKSPEKPAKSNPKTSNKKNGNASKPPDPKNDIRNYIPTITKAPIPKPNNNNKENKPRSNFNAIPNNNQSDSRHTTSATSNVHTITNSSGNPQVTNVIPSKTSNIFGFTNLNGTSSNKTATPKKSGGLAGVKGAVKNAGSSTFVVTKKGSKTLGHTDNSVIPKSSSTTSIQAFSGTGKTLSDSIFSSSSNADYSKVREHWLQKFGNGSQNTGGQNGVKRANTNLPSTCQKIPRLSSSSNYPVSDDMNKVVCPVCKKKFNTEDLNSHLDRCLESEDKNVKECFICGDNVSTSRFQNHISECSEKHFGNDFEDDDAFSSDLMQCPSCLKKFNSNYCHSHKKLCSQSEVVDLTQLDRVDENKNCPVCKESLPSDKYDIHVEKCILKMCDEFDNKYAQSEETKTSCLACNKEILKSELNSHLEDCMSINSVLENSSTNIDDDDDVDYIEAKAGVSENVGNDASYNCPFCLKLILENQMQSHLDQCLNSENSTEEDFKERSLLVESLCSTDSDME